MCSLKLVEEAHIVLREHAQVFHHIFQVGDALDAKSKGITAVHLAVDAARLEHIGVNHAATQNLYPASVLAETAAFATAQHARDIHLGAGLGEWEVTGAQPDFGVFAKEFLYKE